MSGVRNLAVKSGIAALILASPTIAFLLAIAAELLVDLLIEAGATAVSAIAVGAIGWVLFRKFWPLPRPEQKLVPDEPAIATSPI